MKTLSYLFVMAVILIAGCAQDDTMFETPESMELKSAKVPIPLKGEGWSDPDLQSSTRLIIGGIGTHLGKINSEQSYYDFKTQNYVEVDGLPFFDLTGFGKLVGANDDSFDFTFSTIQSLVDYSLVSKCDITPGSGTGKFKDCTGSFNTVGAPDVSGVHLYVFKIEGELVYE
ncbi:MAG TPA: hypothetical protein VLQ91_03875 [Draconibacterium sp.]|nr:hypothetical protein [Draconibacterium sp.]